MAGALLILLGLGTLTACLELDAASPTVQRLVAAETLFDVPIQLERPWAVSMAGGVALLGLMLWITGLPAPPPRATPDRDPRVLPALALITVGALLLRLWKLGDLPPGFFVDEGFNAVDGLSIALGRDLPIYAVGNGGREVLFEYLMAFSYLVLGPTIWASRLPAALAGTATVPAVYLLGRELMRSRRWALAPALLVAVSSWHLSFSRLPFRYVLLPLLAASSAAWILQGLRTGRWGPWLLAGAALGLGAHSYVPIRLFPAVLLFLLLEALRRGERPRAVQLAGGLAVTALLTAPLVAFFLSDTGQVMQRVSQTLLFGTERPWWPGILETGARTVLMFWVWGDVLVRHGCPGFPVLDPMTGALLALGGGAALRRGRTGPALLGWVALMLVPSMISSGIPSSARSLGALPAVMVLGGIGLRELSGLLPRTARRWVPLLLVVPAVMGPWRYFATWPAVLELIPLETESLWGFSRPESRLAERLVDGGDLSGEGSLVLSPQLFLHPSLQFRFHRRIRPELLGDVRTALGRRPEEITRVILNVTRRNLWWIRNSPRKNMFLWPHAEYGLDDEVLARQIFHAYGSPAPVMDSDRFLLARLGAAFPAGTAHGLGDGFVLFRPNPGPEAPVAEQGFHGWEVDEEGRQAWRWIGPEARLRIPLSAPCRIALLLEGDVPLEWYREVPRIRVVAAGRESVTQPSKEGRIELAVPIPPEAWRPEGIEVFIRPDRTVTPAEHGVTDDPRILGLRITRLEVKS